MKAAIATNVRSPFFQPQLQRDGVVQVGWIQWHDFAGADNGGGPKAHKVNGKDHGGTFEITNAFDSRNRAETPSQNMTGIFNALVVARTTKGLIPDISEREQWPRSMAAVRGIITQREGPLALDNVAFVGFGPEQAAYALETCGKCKADAGGFHTYTSNLTFVNEGCVSASIGFAAVPRHTHPSVIRVHGPHASNECGAVQAAAARALALATPGRSARHRRHLGHRDQPRSAQRAERRDAVGARRRWRDAAPND